MDQEIELTEFQRKHFKAWIHDWKILNPGSMKTFIKGEIFEWAGSRMAVTKLDPEGIPTHAIKIPSATI